MASSVTNSTTDSAVLALNAREQMARAARASASLVQFSTEQKNALLLTMADALLANESSILTANQIDIAAFDAASPGSSMRDRLLLTSQRIEDMAQGLREVAALPDPVGQTINEWTRPNGLRIRKVRVPMGVVGIIYESRPNVTVDTVALALKSGNAIVLRGGKEAAHSNRQLAEIMRSVRGVPEGAIELLDSSTRDSTRELIKARGLVDVLVPRGGRELINFVRDNATIPVIETGDGNCHVFVDESADLEMAERIVINAKTSRPSVCNAAEKLLVHEKVAAEFVPLIVRRLIEHGVEVRGDEHTLRLAKGLQVSPAEEHDWGEEYLRLCIAIRVLPGVDAVIEHINRYSTKHSDSIVTKDENNARKFLQLVDSAAVYWNASTRFTDGFEFGFGAEMGISTQKLHCRGPFALEELTSSKYEILGSGQIRG